MIHNLICQSNHLWIRIGFCEWCTLRKWFAGFHSADDITIVFEQPLYSVMEAVGEVAVCFVTSTTAPIFSVDLSVSVAAGGDAEGMLFLVV